VSKDLDKFIKLYRGIRKKLADEVDPPGVLRLRFEDTIYKYDNFKQTINAFLGLSEQDHIRPRSVFNPDISIKNTRLWEKYTTYKDTVKKIEDELSEYCYPY